MTRTFRDLKEGDHAYTIVRGYGAPYAVLEKVSSATPTYLRTLPCYSDGTPMLYFSAIWRRRSGKRVMTGKEGEGCAKRLVLELPDGIRVAQNPKATIPPMPAGIPVGRDAPFDVTTARYAKRMLAVHAQADGSGYKTRAARLIGDGLNARWSGREKAYIASTAQVDKMQRLYAAGFNACVITGRIYHPDRRALDGLTVAEALRLIARSSTASARDARQNAQERRKCCQGVPGARKAGFVLSGPEIGSCVPLSMERPVR